MVSTLSEELAQIAVSTPLDAFPAQVLDSARLALIDHLGLVIAGADHPAAKAARATVRQEGIGPCRVLGTNQKAGPAGASFANGVAAHVLDFDDTLLPIRAHMGSAILPPLLAVGERDGWSVDRVLELYVVGYEIASRLALLLHPDVHKKGWHATAVIGAPTAAAALVRGLGGDLECCVHALGLGANAAGGLKCSFGTMSKAINVGRAAASGLTSALLALDGARSHPDAIGQADYLVNFGGQSNIDRQSEPTQSWSIIRNVIKLYPCGFVAHAALDAIFLLRQRRAGRNIAKAKIFVSAAAISLMGNPLPETELEGRFSLLFSVAVGWVDGKIDAKSYEDESVKDPAYRDLMARMVLIPEAERPDQSARIEVTYDDASNDTCDIRAAQGTPENPTSFSALMRKMESVLPRRSAAAIDLFQQIHQNEPMTVAELLDRLTPG